MDGNKKLYEGMFLVDAAEAVSNWGGLEEAIRKVLSKNQAEVVSLKKWDERKLAYDIKGKSRGTYILCYFNADGGSIAGIERDVRLSERIVRVLVLRVVPGMPGAVVKDSSPELVAAADVKESSPEPVTAADVKESGPEPVAAAEPMAAPAESPKQPDDEKKE